MLSARGAAVKAADSPLSMLPLSSWTFRTLPLPARKDLFPPNTVRAWMRTDRMGSGSPRSGARERGRLARIDRPRPQTAERGREAPSAGAAPGFGI